MLDWYFDENTKKPDEIVYTSAYRATWKCHKCNHIWKTAVRKRTQDGTGCPKCSNKENGKIHTKK